MAILNEEAQAVEAVTVGQSTIPVRRPLIVVMLAATDYPVMVAGHPLPLCATDETEGLVAHQFVLSTPMD
jgi:hypothetical protein